ncbi:hypothetical protein A9404_12870 [Halothiobacillus diazotrophicus]|uniref:Uncharacterized protein n=1 Tax=Halothiobacillus diazotrophicus TaxID=1860122 RepID=A0A191ZJV4_9GAMM|nr:DUF6662 family protein [Halothiobacillus diazotrophicus]ANJ68145.1 hypothetical protein A9404_12870 [Halothiobacillus diazotrophicus]
MRLLSLSRNYSNFLAGFIGLCTTVTVMQAQADENLFGYIKGAEPLPQNANELYGYATHRWDKGAGTYRATDYQIEYERGVTHRFSAGFAFKAQGIRINDLLIDAYIPKNERYAFKPSGIEASAKYAFLTPALDDIGLASYMSLDYNWLDPHSGQRKNTYSLDYKLLAQKYLMDGQLVLAGNLGVETTYAHRKAVSPLPENYEWPTEPEMEIEFMSGFGVSYRFAPNWSVGYEVFYQTEFETEVGTERWSVQGGPSLHYADRRWWATLTWLPQLVGGGERFPEQNDRNLHLIEKTKNELRLKIGYNF